MVSKKPAAQDQKQAAAFIVGIGASAGGLEALKIFFEHVPADTGMAFVIVQHLDPIHKSLLAELLSGHTKMMVKEVSAGVRVRPNHVYIIPPNKGLVIAKQKLQLSKLPEDRAMRRPIDTFLSSLAEDQQDNAIGIVLSGTGTEGTLGLKEIKAAGGITIVQDPETAQFDGMPRSAISAQAADLVAGPEQIGQHLMEFARKGGRHTLPNSTGLPALTEEQLSAILQAIRRQTGYDFSNYKTNTIVRRIAKRTALHGLNSVADYAGFLKKHPEEVPKLYKDFLIGVTAFFRDEKVFKSVETKAVPYLLEKSRDKQDLRIWVCGCSTGEEAYSLAILFREALERKKQYLKVTIFATDMNQEAVDFARTGIYPEAIAADVSPERLQQYFISNENGYQIKKEVRDMVVFAHHNLIKDPPFSKLDLICCRNLLIYIKADLQKKIISVFHYSLNAGGLLLLGTSESIGDQSSLFSAMDARHKLFKKKNGQLHKPAALFELPFVERTQALKKHAAAAGSYAKIKVITGPAPKAEPVAAASPSVIIDKNNDALFFSGDTGGYLSPPEGAAQWNILEMAVPGLRSPLESAIKKARRDKVTIKKKNIKLSGKLGLQVMNLAVKPLLTKSYDSGSLMVIFEAGKESSTYINMETELSTARGDLRKAILDLKGANENLQSANEELQSSNEELETSREELQSLNEELVTVNSELTGKIDQLSQSNNDLNNLLRSIEVATVYLDRELKVKRFTPAATKIFNLISTDIDRPLTQLLPNLRYENLKKDVNYTLKTLETKAIEVCATDGTWYYMRIIPYRTADNIIEGVLITLVDITSQKMVEQDLANTNEHLNLVMENLPAIPFTCTVATEPEFSFVGKSCEKVTGFPPGQFTGKNSFWIKRIHPEDKAIIKDAFAGIAKKVTDEQPFRWKCADGQYRQFINYLRYTAGGSGKSPYVAGIWQQILETRPPEG